MQRALDDRILEILALELVLTPSVIGRNIDYSSTAVQNRLKVLVEAGFVEKPERGHYRIDDLGRQWLAGEIDAADIPVEG